MQINWITAGKGRLALSHRPKLQSLKSFAEQGCNRIVTVQGRNEQPMQVGNAATEAGLAWLWIPVASGKFPEGEADRALRKGLKELLANLEAGETILIHCSAGIHRTGMLAWAALRMLGASESEALERIGEMRMETKEGMRPEHFAWGNQLVGG